jgi:D-threo-aldose 1-dehydrogenase
MCYQMQANRIRLGHAGISVPRIIYGTSYLGNLYRELSFSEKKELMMGWFWCTDIPVVIDTAGKYGAGLALEVIGKGLEEMGKGQEEIIISNKLGWYRVPLKGAEPTFETGAWINLTHDCELRFGYEGIIQCYEQGNQLLGGKYSTELVSVHDPDEYLHAAKSPVDRDERLSEIMDSYRALFDLKKEGRVKGVGIGCKEWTVISELYDRVPFDWVMMANSYTLLKHPPELLDFMDRLMKDGVGIINSAVFHGGFLTGGDTFDYREVDPDSEQGHFLYSWRDRLYETCREHGVDPGGACIQFGLSHPAVAAIALNTSRPEKMKQNMEILEKEIPASFWIALKEKGLINPQFKYL